MGHLRRYVNIRLLGKAMAFQLFECKRMEQNPILACILREKITDHMAKDCVRKLSTGRARGKAATSVVSANLLCCQTKQAR